MTFINHYITYYINQINSPIRSIDLNKHHEWNTCFRKSSTNPIKHPSLPWENPVFLGFPWFSMAFPHGKRPWLSLIPPWIEVMIVLDGVSAVGSSARVLRAFRMIRARGRRGRRGRRGGFHRQNHGDLMGFNGIL